MDSATQFILGASVAGVTLGRALGPRALLVGGLLGTLPDLDSFIPMGNAIDNMTYHRGFSHSVFVLSAISPAIAYVLKRSIEALKERWWLTLLGVWLCLVTHPILDSLTTYGTQIFWPLGNAPPGLAPVAFPAVFIIDPVYTLVLLAGVIVFWRRGRDGARALRICLALSTLYLGVGVAGNLSVRARAETHPAFQGKLVHVQPTPFNILGWQILGVDGKQTVAALTGIAPSCSIVPVIQKPRTAQLPDVASMPASVKRLVWFTDGFYQYRVAGDKLIMSDLRIGFAPSFVFSFEVARRIGERFKGIDPVRFPLDVPRAEGLRQLLGKVLETLKTCV